MATNDLIGISYNDGYIWNFKVTKDTAPVTVGVKAIAIDKTLYVTEIGTTGNNLLVTNNAVINYVAQEIAKLGKLELEVVSVLPTAGENTLGKIYLVSKGERKTGYTEHITVKGGTEESPTYAWEEIGDTDVDLSNYYNKTDVDNLLANKVDAEKDMGLSSNDFTDAYMTKLNGITEEATNVTANKDSEGNLTSMTIKSGEKSETYTFPTPEEPMIAFDEIKVGDKSAKAVAGKTALTIEAGDGIVLETTTEKESGGPALKISVDTTDVIDIVEEIPTDTSKDNAIPNVDAVKAYVDDHKGSSPTYVDGLIDLTV